MRKLSTLYLIWNYASYLILSFMHECTTCLCSECTVITITINQTNTLFSGCNYESLSIEGHVIIFNYIINLLQDDTVH